MRSLVFFEIQGVFVSVRRQQLAPKFTIGVLGCGQVDRPTKRVSEAFNGAVKVIFAVEDPTRETSR